MPAATLGAINSENPVGWVILVALLGKVIYDQATKPPLQWHTTIADPGAGYGHLKAEDAAKEDTTDVNVPDESPPNYRGKSNSKNEKHGDGGRALSKAENQIAELEKQLEGSPKKERKKIEQKIKNIRQTAEKKKKGIEHSGANKR